MMEMIKKIFGILSTLPAFTSLFQKAAQTGKLDPVEALNALSSISPSASKCAESAITTIEKGGNVKQALQNATNYGEIDVGIITGNKGQTVNTRTITRDLRNVGEPDSFSRKFGVGLANLIEELPTQDPQETVNFGKAAMDVHNWEDIIKNN